MDRQRRYQSLWGVRARYLPATLQHLRAWHEGVREAVARRKAEAPVGPRVGAVSRLQRDLQRSGVLRMYVEEMIAGVPNNGVKGIPDLLDQLEHVVRLTPHWEADPNKRNFFPLSALFAEMMMDPAGEAAFRYPPFNDAIRAVLQQWCAFLDSGDSCDTLNEGDHGWLCPAAAEYNQLDHFVIPDRSAPHWGWKSYNDFFHREIQPAVRPIAGPGDPRVIVSPNDGTVYRIAHGVEPSQRFWAKDEPYSLHDMLDGSDLLDRFIGGHVFQSYLSGADYHRWHAPVDGVVRDAYVIEGLMFSNLVNDISGVASQAYYTAVNTRGLTFIEADDPAIGMVCVMPVGITEVSSIALTARTGARVRKGDQLGCFSFGGSSIAVLFERAAIDHFTVAAPHDLSDPQQQVKIAVNAQIAVARSAQQDTPAQAPPLPA
jgi:phosphatidylserine decarboxylase